MAEVLFAHLDKIKQSAVLNDLGLKDGKYILLSAHREENIDNERNFFSLMNAINKMAEYYDMPVIYSTHPRSANFIKKRAFKFHQNVRSLEPFGFSDYNRLQLGAFCVVSDSGTLPEESAFFNSIGMPFPSVCIRTSTERPEALDRGGFILAGITETQLLQAVEIAVNINICGDSPGIVPDYSDINVSMKVVKLIQSYTGIIDRTVWRKTVD